MSRRQTWGRQQRHKCPSVPEPLVHWREVCLAACGRVFWDEQGHAPSWSGETAEEVVQVWATCMQDVSHQCSWGLCFPCYKTRLMINPLFLSGRNENVQEAPWPPTKHTAQAGEPRRGHTPVQKIGSFTRKRAQILDYRRRPSEKNWQSG